MKHVNHTVSLKISRCYVKSPTVHTYINSLAFQLVHCYFKTGMQTAKGSHTVCNGLSSFPMYKGVQYFHDLVLD